MIEILAQCKTDVEQSYESLRILTTPLPDIIRKMDSVISEIIIVLKEWQKEYNQIFNPVAVKNPSPNQCRGKMPGPFLVQLCPDSVEVAVRSLKYSQRRLRRQHVWLLNE